VRAGTGRPSEVAGSLPTRSVDRSAGSERDRRLHLGGALAALVRPFFCREDVRHFPTVTMNPLVTVAIPAYNNAAYVAQAVQSALGQTLEGLEVIVVDDGSTDATRTVLAPYIQAERVHYIYQANAGSARARNQAIRAARGEYVAFLDADDTWVAEKTQRQLQYLNDHDFDFVYCDKLWVDENGKPIEGAYTQQLFPEGRIFRDLFTANYISTSSAVIVRRTCLQDVGGFRDVPELRNSQDYDLWLRLADRYSCGALRQPLVRYRVHGTNRTKDVSRAFVGEEACLKYALTLPSIDDVPRTEIRRRFARLYRNYGRTCFVRREHVRAKGAYLAALKASALSLGTRDLAALVVATWHSVRVGAGRRS
jgi:glycosyltransferase involved in cell wall biosynthesis